MIQKKNGFIFLGPKNLLEKHSTTDEYKMIALNDDLERLTNFTDQLFYKNVAKNSINKFTKTCTVQ